MTREESIKDLQENGIDLGAGDFVSVEALHMAIAALMEKEKRGRWLPQTVLGQKAWDCSECKTLGSPHWKWCPVCGARMEEV